MKSVNANRSLTSSHTTWQCFMHYSAGRGFFPVWLFVFLKLFTLLSHGCRKNFKLPGICNQQEGNCTARKFFWLYFPFASYKGSWSSSSYSSWENPWQPALSDSLAVSHVIGLFTSPPETGEQTKQLYNFPCENDPTGYAGYNSSLFHHVILA